LVIKGTSLASTVTVMEITGYAKRLMSQTYAIIEIFAFAGVLYLLLNGLMIVALRIVEKRLMRHQV
jgi:octopine/nopaline transport system permease protein